jgi:NTP pyrophosphatase (non-canonical NTP hydrolase)
LIGRSPWQFLIRPSDAIEPLNEGGSVDLDEYQQATESTDIRLDPYDPALPLLGLAGEVGSLVTEYKKKLRSGQAYTAFDAEVREDIGDLLWYAATLARAVGLSLNDIAAANLDKTALMWGDKLPPPPMYDASYPDNQRLPRRFTVRFVTAVGDDGLPRVNIYSGKEPFGDRLDDNAYEDDGYRFHDAFHLAHAAVLGWSPVARALFRHKRRRDLMVDRVEDGARAIAREEGLTAFIFSEAEARGFFEGAERVDWDLLKTVRKMVRHLEVGDQPPNAWRRAILQGYGVWLKLREHGGGIVEGDLDSRTIWVRS